MTTRLPTMTGNVDERYTPSPGRALFVLMALRSSSRTLVPAGTKMMFGAGTAAAGAASAAGVAEAVCIAAGATAGPADGTGVAGGASCAATVRLPARVSAVRARRRWVIGDLRETHTYCASGRRGGGNDSGTNRTS